MISPIAPKITDNLGNPSYIGISSLKSIESSTLYIIFFLFTLLPKLGEKKENISFFSPNLEKIPRNVKVPKNTKNKLLAAKDLTYLLAI